MVRFQLRANAAASTGSPLLNVVPERMTNFHCSHAGSEVTWPMSARTTEPSGLIRPSPV